MSYSARNGVKTYYEVSGDGYPLVLVHANPFDRRLWMYQVAHFSTFLEVINIDLRGYGYSDEPAKSRIQHLTSLVSKEFPQTKLGKYLLSFHTEMDSRLHAPAIAEIFRALQNRDFSARLPELKMPVLVVNGEFDNALTRSREMTKKISDAEHHTIPGTRHACCLEDPVMFDEIVLSFLKKRGLIGA